MTAPNAVIEFTEGLPGFEGAPLQSVDPGGVVGRAIPFEQVLGCVVHASTATSEPGLVEHRMGQGLIVGEASGGLSERVQRVVALLQNAGFDATASANISAYAGQSIRILIQAADASTASLVEAGVDDVTIRQA